MQISVIICTHNPNAERLRRTLLALSEQTLAAVEWELLVVDNASSPALTISALSNGVKTTVVREETLGLSHARRRGAELAVGQTLVFVDDDNVLARDYLELCVSKMASAVEVGVIGGKAVPEFETQPEAWQKEFYPLLALRDLGEAELISETIEPAEGVRAYPPMAPIGAGLAVRRQALDGWLHHKSMLRDRTGTELSSGGDNEIVLHVLKEGWRAAYCPQLVLTHLIPKARLRPEYLERLNHGIQRTWAQFLLHHEISPWPRIPPWTVPLRKAKAWLTYRAWRDPASRVRWHGARGHFEGRANPL